MFEDQLHLAETQYTDNPTPYNWLLYQSVYTWDRLGFARRTPQTQLYETTITQDFLYDCWRMAKARFPLYMFQSKDEKRNGTDIELFLETNGGFVFLPMQAKLLKPNHVYSEMNHRNSFGAQIDLLIKYASERMGHPLYLLYNHCTDQRVNNHIEQHNGNRPVEHYGLSVTSAIAIKRDFSSITAVLNTPSFADVHPTHAWPLCDTLLLELLSLLNTLNLLFNLPGIHLYSLDEIRAQDGWRDMAPAATIGRIPSPEKAATPSDYNHNDSLAFRPMYRIVFLQERPAGTVIRRLS